MLAINVQNLSKSFNGQVVLNNLNLRVAPYELVGLRGPSGSGKTTLLRIIAGLERNYTGVVQVNGQVALVFQDLALWPHLSAFEQINFVLGARQPLDNVSAAHQIEKLFAQVRFPYSLARKFPHQLSGGEQQRLALARALAQEPDILLLDEPLSNLDFTLKEQIRQEIKRIHHEQGLTTLYVTHDPHELDGLTNRVIELA